MLTLSSRTEHDLRRLLDVVSPDAVASPGTELPDEVLRGVAELIPCTSINIHILDTNRAAMVGYQEWNPAGLRGDDDESETLFWEAFSGCRSCSDPTLFDGRVPVSGWQDFYSERDFAKLKMADYLRLVGFWHELLVYLPARDGVQARILLTRDASDRPFDERDRLLLSLLRPHLVDIRHRIEAERRTIPALTVRQVELLRRVASGDTNRQIARALGLSEGTVRKHLEHIYARLGVHSRTEAVARISPPLDI